MTRPRHLPPRRSGPRRHRPPPAVGGHPRDPSRTARPDASRTTRMTRPRHLPARQTRPRRHHPPPPVGGHPRDPSRTARPDASRATRMTRPRHLSPRQTRPRRHHPPPPVGGHPRDPSRTARPDASRTTRRDTPTAPATPAHPPPKTTPSTLSWRPPPGPEPDSRTRRRSSDLLWRVGGCPAPGTPAPPRKGPPQTAVGGPGRRVGPGRGSRRAPSSPLWRRCRARAGPEAVRFASAASRGADQGRSRSPPPDRHSLSSISPVPTAVTARPVGPCCPRPPRPPPGSRRPGCGW
ncbi:hypothetical protein SAMN05216489_06990 [Streptomyces sp. 3213]|nr:hypothetical protein SAMN05216489_06990 [Streptomyces sp. 3213] [Streptomyces sp. 3213.3]